VASGSTLLINPNLKSSSRLTEGGVIIDLGTGDGRFVYQSAKEHPERFYIGIDASHSSLEKISQKSLKKPAKGGLPNVLFVHAALEDLPSELDGVADEVHVHFPWGSLLKAVVSGDPELLGGLRRICSPGALVEVVFGLDPDRDRSEIERLGLKPITTEYLLNTVIPAYKEAGFELFETGVLAGNEWDCLDRMNSSWAQKLRHGSNRSLMYLIAHAQCVPEIKTTGF
jgi:16S rRNA (adenine(1408)-N(1))-methyltransferase